MTSIVNAPDLPSDDEEDQDYDPTRYVPLTDKCSLCLCNTCEGATALFMTPKRLVLPPARKRRQDVAQ